MREGKRWRIYSKPYLFPLPVFCLQGKQTEGEETGTWIRKGDKIGQFRIMEVMPEIEFEEVETFGNSDRGGFGSTGKK